MYETIHGSHVSKRAVNRHHVMFESNRYTDSFGRAYRNLSGLVLPMLVEVHNELHAEVLPPIKPCKLLMVDIIQTAQRLPDMPVYDQFQAFSNRFYQLSQTNSHTRINYEAGRIHDNLQQQNEFIAQGIVVPAMELV